MTETEMLKKLLPIFPDLELGEDNDGQLIICTNTRLINGIVDPFDDEYIIKEITQ